MADEFKLPDIGEGLVEGEIVKWLVAVGDTVEEDQPLVEVMTDKATVEIPSPQAGTVAELAVAEGDIVEIGTTILMFGDADALGPASADEIAPAAGITESTVALAAASTDVSADDLEMAREVAKAERLAVESAAERKPWDAPAILGGAVAPAARRLAGELGVAVADVTGSGPGGLVTKDDIRAFASGVAAAVGPLVAPEPVVVEAPAEPVVEANESVEPVAEPSEPVEPVVEEEEEEEPLAPEAVAEVEAPAAGDRCRQRGRRTRRSRNAMPLRGLRRTIAETDGASPRRPRPTTRMSKK